MLRLITSALLALSIVVGLTQASEAQVYIRAPLIRIQTGPGPYPPAPSFSMRIPLLFRLDVGSAPPPPVIVSQSGPVLPAPDVPPQPPIELGPPPAPVKAPTLAEFASAFKPMAGTHQVVILHPVTGEPVNVTFTLPPGEPKVHVLRRDLIFDYGRQQVEIRCQLRGGVRVVSR
jgi:hypothetical protein